MNRSEAAREKWSGIMTAQEQSGLSVVKFCERRGIPASSLFAWRRKLRGAENQAQPVSGFVEALVSSAGGLEARVTIELASSRRITVGPGFNRQVLLEVIAALETDVAQR